MEVADRKGQFPFVFLAMAEPLATLTVEDSQPAEYHPDNQLGLEDSQHEFQLAEPVGIETTETVEDTLAVEGKDEKTQGEGGDKKEETQVVASTELAENGHEKGPELEQFPETLAYQDGSQGPTAAKLVRREAFCEEDPDQLLEAEMMKCKKCGLEVELTQAIIRGPTELWCKACNSLYTMLRRNLSWPPECFHSLSDDAQQSFWARCRREKEESKKTMFSYKSVRDTLITQVCEETKKVKTVGAGGTYLPLSVYRQRGYEIDAGFCERNPCQWSPGLQQNTYLLVECSVNEQEIRMNTEKQILEAERAVKKRKAADMVEDEEEKKSVATAATQVMDLVTESEDEGHYDSVMAYKGFKFGSQNVPIHVRLTEPQEVQTIVLWF